MRNSIKVSKNIFSKCKTIEKAITMSQPGDTIHISKGIYKESLHINKNLTLIGESGTILEGSIQTNNKVNITIESLEIKESMAINIARANIQLLNCSCTGDVLVHDMATMVLQNCIITPSNEGLVIQKKSHANLINTKIIHSPKSGLSIKENSNVKMVGCEMFKNKNRTINVEHSELSIDYCQLEVQLKLSNSVLTLFNSKIPNCYGMAVEGRQSSRITIENCEIYKGFLYFNNANGIITKSKIYNMAFVQKGIVGVQADLKISGCEIYDSSSHGIMLTQQCKATIVDCNIHHNMESNVYCSESDVQINNCKLYESGSGIIVDQSNVEVIHSQITHHKTFGIHTVTTPSQVTLTDTTVAHNTVHDIAESHYKILFTKHGTRHLESDVANMVKLDSVGIASTPLLEKNNKVTEHTTADVVTTQQHEQLEVATADNASEGLFELHQLIGLTTIKTQVEDLFKFIEFNKELTKFDLADEHSSVTAEHTLLYGNPGTGKTTVAKILGKIYKELGLLEKGHVVQVNREKLVGEYIGHTAIKTQEKINEAMGGVLFIDEAYSLTNKQSKSDFGPEAIEVIIEAMENQRGDFIVVAAGYETEMQQFIEVNPGLQSRFTRIYELEDYTPKELIEIAQSIINKKNRFITNDANILLLNHFTDLWRQRDQYFSNARLVRNTVDRILAAQMIRCIDMPTEERTREKLQEITSDDIHAILQENVKKEFNLPINEKLLSATLEDLNKLVGLDSVKYDLQKLITLTRYYKEEERDLTTLSSHIVLTGNPGTGKTVVARIIAKIYEALGIVERGDLIEVSRDQLVSPYSGETEKLIADTIQIAMHGTLFIDEAYQLTQYGSSDSGHKVVEILLKYMEDYRGQFNVIVAGYPDEMEKFLDSNAGLRRRFVHQLKFEDYTPMELVNISQSIVQQNGYHLADDSIQALQTYYINLYQDRNKTFGNAGLARNIMLEAIKNVDYRVAKLSKVEREMINKKEILVEDLTHITENIQV